MDGRAGEGAAIREQVDMNVNTIRTITIKGEGQQSLDSLSSSLQKVATNTKTVASVTDITTKSTLSAEQAYKRQTLMVDAAARAQDQFARQARIADQALNQGKITAAEHATRIGVLQDRYSQAGKATQALTSAMGGLGKVFSAVSSAAATLGLALGVGAMVAYGKSVFNTTADLQEQADQILGAGGNVEALQALRGIFLTNGISQEQGDKILQKLTRSLGEASEGSKKAKDAFHGMGLGAKELAGTTADAALPLVAKKLLEIKDATKRAALEAAIFGKTGQQLEPSLKALASGSMSDLIARAKELGVVIDANLIKKADEAKDKMALSFMKLQVAIAPLIVSWGEGFAKLVGNIDKVTKSLSDLWEKAKMFGGAAIGARVGFSVGGVPGAVVGGVAGLAAAGPTTNQLSSSVDRYNAQLAAGGLSPSERADITARRDRALASYNSGVGYSGLVVRPGVTSTSSTSSGNGWAQTSGEISAAAAAAKKLEDSRHKVMLDEKEIEASTNTILQAGIKQLQNSIKEEQHQAQVAEATDQYIRDLQTEVDMVNMSSAEREKQAAIMEAMRVSENKLTEAQKQHITATVTARQEAEKWRGVVDDISYGFQGFFEDVLNNGKLSFDSLWNTVKQSFVRMLAQMATEALIQPIIVPIVGGMTSALGGIGNFLGGGSSGLGSLFSGGLNSISRLFSGGGASSAASSIGGLGLGGLGNFLGGVGIGSLAGSLVFGNKADAGLGSMAGAALGQLLIPIPGVGAIIGGLLGGGLGSMTGSSNQGAISNFTNGGLGNTLFKAGGGQNGAMATQASSTINQALQALKDAGVDVSLGNISGLSIGSDKSYVYDFAGGKQKLAGGEAGISATVNAILDRILPSASSGDSAVQELLAKYGGLNSGNLAAFSTDLQAQKAQKEQEAADAAAQALQDLADQFNVLGGDLKTFADGLSDSSKAARDAASNWEKARDNLEKARTALLISAPGLSPIDQYNNSRSQLDSLLNSARGGSSQAANDFASFAGQFLQTSFGFNGSTTAYAGDLSYVQQSLGSLSSFSEAQRSYAQRQADALDAAVAQLSAIYTAISEGNNQTNEGLAALRQDFDELSQNIKDGNLQARMVS